MPVWRQAAKEHLKFSSDVFSGSLYPANSQWLASILFAQLKIKLNLRINKEVA